MTFSVASTMFVQHGRFIRSKRAPSPFERGKRANSVTFTLAFPVMISRSSPKSQWALVQSQIREVFPNGEPQRCHPHLLQQERMFEAVVTRTLQLILYLMLLTSAERVCMAAIHHLHFSLAWLCWSLLVAECLCWVPALRFSTLIKMSLDVLASISFSGSHSK